MSHLIKEDDDFLYLYRYIHDQPDSFSEWEMQLSKDRYLDHHKYPEYIQIAEHNAFFEIKAIYRIRKSDGKVFYDSYE